MPRLHEQAQGHTKETTRRLIGNEQLVLEGERQVCKAEGEPAPRHSDQGIVQDEQGQEQPRDKERAQTVHKTNADNSVPKV